MGTLFPIGVLEPNGPKKRWSKWELYGCMGRGHVCKVCGM